jgi:hypothetical protein
VNHAQWFTSAWFDLQAFLVAERTGNGQGLHLSMATYTRLVAVLLTVLLASACTSTSAPEISPETGMARALCPAFKDSLEKANKEVWALAEIKTSVESAQKAVIDVTIDASTISAITNEPAKSWLQGIQDNGRNFLNWFGSSNNGDSQELIQIYSQWKSNFQSLETYCP